MFLTKEEVYKLTGKKKRPQQLEELAERHYPYEINKNGEILILRKVVEERLGFHENPERISSKPNFENSQYF